MKGIKLLKDIHGKEINVGDFLQVGDPLPMDGKPPADIPTLQKGQVYMVLFSDGQFIFKAKPNGAKKRRLWGAAIRSNGLKVIGNIVDNPELKKL
jgi:hypothetical protein